MAKKLIPFAIAYDFDGTLAPGNMQEFDFVPTIGMTKKAFWREVGELAKSHDADNILMYIKPGLHMCQCTSEVLLISADPSPFSMASRAGSTASMLMAKSAV